MYGRRGLSASTGRVFVDGCFWHGCRCKARPTSNSAFWLAKIAYNQARDRRNNAALAAAGWAVVRVWEHEDLETAVERIAAAVRA
jgi:DNA mismatch endonuclease, patch repair protein